MIINFFFFKFSYQKIIYLYKNKILVFLYQKIKRKYVILLEKIYLLDSYFKFIYLFFILIQIMETIKPLQDPIKNIDLENENVNIV